MTRSQRRWASTIAKAKAYRVLSIWRAPVTKRAVGRAAAMHCTCPCQLCTHKTPDSLRRAKRDMEKLHHD